MNQLALLLLSLLAAAPQPAPVPAVSTGEWVRLETQSGQRYQGKLVSDPESDRIVLRNERAGIVLEHSFARQQITHFMAMSPPVEPTITAEQSTPPLPARTGPFRPLAELGTASSDHQLPQAQATGLRFSAGPGNWSTGVKPDGLALDIFTPLGTDASQLRGSLEVELYGWRTARDRRPDAPQRLERWVLPLDGLNTAGRTTFELPYRQSRPQTDMTIAPGGLLHVRVNVPGEAVVERSLTDVRLRPYSSWRDRLQQTTGRRYLTTEWPGP